MSGRCGIGSAAGKMIIASNVQQMDAPLHKCVSVICGRGQERYNSGFMPAARNNQHSKRSLPICRLRNVCGKRMTGRLLIRSDAPCLIAGLMTSSGGFFWTFEQAVSYCQFTMVNYIGFTDRGMLLVGGCGDTNGKPQIDKTAHLQGCMNLGRKFIWNSFSCR